MNNVNSNSFTWVDWGNQVIHTLVNNKYEIEKLEVEVKKNIVDITKLQVLEKDKERLERKLKELENNIDEFKRFSTRISTMLSITTGLLGVTITVLVQIIF